MGDHLEHAIIVSGEGPLVRLARRKALRLGMSVTDIVEAPVNGLNSFLVGPDASKEGWPESHEGDRQRGQFIDWLNEQCYASDFGNPLSWVLVQYGSSRGYQSRILNADDWHRDRERKRTGWTP